MPHGQRKHAKWSGSNAHRWMVCHGQPNLLQAVPAIQRRDTDFSAEGTLAHELLEATLRRGIGTHADTGNERMDASVNTVVDYIVEIRDVVPDVEFSFEQPAVFPQDVVPANECGTIIDVLGYSSSRRAGWVIDFKHGVVPVDATDNSQLLFGATSVFWDKPVDELHLAIIQPNGFYGDPIKEHFSRAYDLLDFRDAVISALEISSGFSAPLTPGDHCHWCPADPVCLAREEYALREMTDAKAAQLPVNVEAYAKAVDLTTERKAAIKRAAPALRSWLTSVENSMTVDALNGTEFPGFKLVEAGRRRRWEGDHTAIANELIVLSNYELGIDDVMPRELVNITEIEPRLAKLTTEQAVKGKKKQAVEDLKRDFATLTTHSSSGSLTLVSDEDPRTAAKPSAKAFAHVAIETPEIVGD